MNSDSSYTEVTGKIVALSHIFRTRNGPLYFIELQSEGKLVYIIVNDIKHFHWLQCIEQGSVCSISRLYHTVIMPQTLNLNALQVTVTSKLLLLKKCEDSERFCCGDEIHSTFISFQGIITSVVSEELGIYQIDGTTSLYLTYLKGVVAEFADVNKNVLSIGDNVALYNVHRLQRKDGSIMLVCCGRSYVKTNKLCQSVSPISLSEWALLHCIHIYNLGIDFLCWLLSLEKLLLGSLQKGRNPDIILKRQCYGRKGVLVEFLRTLEGCSTLKSQHRSILGEFLSRQHSCVLLQEFQEPICPIAIKEISLQLQDCEYSTEPVWKYSVIMGQEHRYVVFGYLKLTSSGYLKLEVKSDFVYIVVLEFKNNLYNKLGHFVAILDFDWVEEYFSIYGLEDESLTKKYIVVHPSNILSLASDDTKEDISGSLYELKIFSKSRLQFKYQDCMKGRESSSKFFVCSASVTHEDSHPRKESWKSLICIKEKFAELYPFVSEKTKVKGRLVPTNSLDGAFKKCYSFAWLRNLQDHFGHTECSDVPANFVIESIEPSETSFQNTSIMDLLEGQIDEQDIVAVEGLVISRRMISPLYESEKLKLPSSLLNRQIGIPGSKILIICLEDCENRHAKVYVYINCGNEWHIMQYPLGIIPGIKLCVTWLKQKKSRNQNKRIYLTSTNFTMVNVISRIASQPPKGITLDTCRRSYLVELNTCEPLSVVTLLATISRIWNISLKYQCSFCGSDYKNGVCEYVGCHGSGEGILSGSARFVIDDGTAVATVFATDVQHIRVLSNLNSHHWDLFVKSIGEEFVLSFKDSNECEADPDKILLSSVFSTPQILRPVIMTCRIYRKTSVSLSTDLFLLDIKQLQHSSDWQKILRPVT